MQSLRPSEVAALTHAVLERQQAQRLVERRDGWAFMAAVVANCTASLGGKRGKATPDDFLSDEAKSLWRRLQESGEGAGTARRGAAHSSPQPSFDEHIAMARAKGLRTPGGGGDR